MIRLDLIEISHNTRAITRIFLRQKPQILEHNEEHPKNIESSTRFFGNLLNTRWRQIALPDDVFDQIPYIARRKRRNVYGFDRQRFLFILFTTFGRIDRRVHSRIITTIEGIRWRGIGRRHADRLERFVCPIDICPDEYDEDV